MTDDDYDALSQKQLASIKRDMRISLEDAAVRATYKVMAELETNQTQGEEHMTKEALKLALEALESIQRYGLDTLSGRVDGPDDREWQRAGVNEMTKRAQLGVTDIKEALAQPEQEPVATLDDLEQEIYENTRQFVSHDVMEWMLKRYYTTPPQRTWVGLVGLTDEEIKEGESKEEQGYGFIQGALWAEAKLKEKNES